MAQLQVALRCRCASRTRHSASLLRTQRVFLARLAGHAQSGLVRLVEPGTARVMAGARPMAGLALYSSDEFPLLPTESALLPPFLLLQAVLSWKLFLEARLAVSVIATLSFRIRLAASRFMGPATIRLDLAGMGTAHQDAEAEHLEEEPQDSQTSHGARFERDREIWKIGSHPILSEKWHAQTQRATKSISARAIPNLS